MKRGHARFAFRVEPLDGGHPGAGDCADRGDAASSRAPFHVYCACAAQADPATELGSL